MPPRVAPSASPQPSLVVVVKTDFLALVGAIAPVVGLVLAAASAAGFLPDRHRSMTDGRVEWFPAQPGGVAAIIAAACFLAGAVLVAWRTKRIRASFAAGHRVEGTITRLRPFKDRAWVQYAYRLQGTLHEARHLVHQTSAYRALAEGQTVTIAVDPSRPGGGFVVELFEGGQTRAR